MDTELLERSGGSMGENPHQLGGMGEHCKLTIGVWSVYTLKDKDD